MKCLTTGAACVLALLSGCATFSRETPPVGLGATEDSIRLAEALAHYSRGLLSESHAGWFSSEARHHFSQAIELDPLAHFLHYRLALNYLTRGQPDEAVDILEKSCRASPNLPQAWIDLATVCQITGRIDPAISHYRRAIRLARAKSSLYHELVRILLLRQRDAEALDVLRQGLRDGDNRDLLLFFAYNQGRHFFDREEMQRSLPFFQLVAANIRDDQLSAAFYLHHGAAHERTGQLQQSEEIFLKCLALYPDTHEVLNYLAYMWAERGAHLERALEYVTRALEKEPDNGAYVDTLGWIYFKQNRYRDALEQMQKANRLIQDDPTVADHLGDAFFALRDRANAVRWWRQSLLLDPLNQNVAVKLRSEGVDVEPIRREAEERKKQRKAEEDAPPSDRDASQPVSRPPNVPGP